jgi:DNA-binding transcriptional regulator YdaS (Cro superfamily)
MRTLPKPRRKTALDEVLKAVGGYRALGRHLGISHQAITHWKQVPAKHLVAIEKISGVPRERLRPELYR